jgi:hypothetical protein
MSLLEESTVRMRLQFNERFLSLRELKKQIIYSIRRDNKRIRAIDNEVRVRVRVRVRVGLRLG